VKLYIARGLRELRSVRALVLTLVLAAGAAQAEPPPLHFSLDRGVTCPSVAQLGRALDHRLGWGVASEGSPVEGARSLRLSLQEVDLLRIVLSAGPGAPPSQRTLAIHSAECRELADTVALLTEAWLRELTWGEIAPPEPLPPPVPPPPVPVVIVPPPPAETKAEHNEPAVPLTLRLAGSGLLFFNAGSPGVQFGGFGVALDLEASLGPRFGAGLEAAWDAPLFAVLGPSDSPTGSITVERASASAYGRFSFRPGQALGVDALAGLRATHLWPSSVVPHLQGTGQGPLWTPGFWLAGTVDQRLGKGWSAFLQLRANIEHSYQFELPSTPGGVFLPSFSLQALVGVGWRFL
jgi:hypothetical protein